MVEIQEKVVEKRGRNIVSRAFHAKNDKETIAGWNSDLDRFLQIFTVGSVVFTWLSLTVPFQTELVVNMHVMVSDLHRNALAGRDGVNDQHCSVSRASPPINDEMLTIH